MDVVWEARLTLVTEKEINDKRKPDKTPTRAEPDVEISEQEELRELSSSSYHGGIILLGN